MVLRITSRSTSLELAFEAVAALVLCAVKVVISIPGIRSFKTSLVHLEVVSRDTKCIYEGTPTIRFPGAIVANRSMFNSGYKDKITFKASLFSIHSCFP